MCLCVKPTFCSSSIIINPNEEETSGVDQKKRDIGGKKHEATRTENAPDP